jgi:integrase
MASRSKNAVRLTQRFAETTKVPLGQETTFHDTELQGFGLRVRSNGSRAWILRQNARRIAIGPINAITEADARKRAKAIIGAKASGRDLLEEEAATKRARAVRAARDRLTVGYCFTAYIESGWPLHATESYRRRLNRLLAEHLLSDRVTASKPIVEFGYADVLRMMNRIPTENWGTGQKLIQAIQSAYKYFRKHQEIIDSVGVLSTPEIGELRPSSKVADDLLRVEQWRRIYEAAESVPNIWHSAYFRFAILSAVRTGAIRSMRWSDIVFQPNDFESAYWRVPAEHNRKGRNAGDGFVHVLPLTPRMIALLEEMPRTGEYVFGGDLIRVAKGAKTLDKLRDAAGFRYDDNGNQWRLHGVRATMASTELGIEETGAVNAVQGRGGDPAKLRNYYRGDYLHSQLRVLLKWDEYLFFCG